MNKFNKRLRKLEQVKQANDEMIVAWEGPILNPKPGQIVIGSGYPFRDKQTEQRPADEQKSFLPEI